MDNLTSTLPPSSSPTVIEIRAILETAITQVQDLGGNQIPEFIDSLVLLGGIERFDSLTAVEVFLILSTELPDIELPEDIFYDPESHAPLTLSQVVQRIYEIAHGKSLTEQTGEE